MGRPRDYDEIKTTEDILHRYSRPQRNSSWEPKKRDWRYMTGVYKHDDHESREKTIWDLMDEDANLKKTKERRRAESGAAREDELMQLVEVDFEESDENAAGSPGEGEEEGEVVATPKRISSKELLTPDSTPKKQAGEAVEVGSRTPKTSRALSTQFSESCQNPLSGSEQEWTEVGLVVMLRLPNLASSVQQILSRPPTPLSLSSPPITPLTLHTPSTPTSAKSVETVETFPLFEREWKDNTSRYNAKKLKASLRGPDRKVEDLLSTYTWFPEATPVDAIFPPGVPMSAKEIAAYYPHHIRWKGIALRFLNNGYRSSDILEIQSWFRGHPTLPMPIRHMTENFRQLLRSRSEFEGISNFKSKPDANLYTDDLDPNQFVARRGHLVPTFDDLLAGLTYLPSGLDARELTQCLRWYLNYRHAFTPRLELNVLHTQSLIRALRMPLKSYGTRNLDIIGLTEWKENRRFAEHKVEAEKKRHRISNNYHEVKKGSRLHMDIPTESVKLEVDLPLRHILMFPFLLVQNTAGEALKMGIKNAEQRQAGRKRRENEQVVDKAGEKVRAWKATEAEVSSSPRIFSKGVKRNRDHETDPSQPPPKRTRPSHECVEV